MLKGLIERLQQEEAKIISELQELEEPAIASLEACNDALHSSPVAQNSLSINESLSRTEEFANMLMDATKNTSTAINGLRCSLNVVDMVSQLYDLGSHILSNYQKGDIKKGAEHAASFISAVNKAKTDGYWEEVAKVITRGHINQVISDLRIFVIGKLREHMSSEDSKLFMRLAVTLNASSEAYESYLKTIHEKTHALQSSSPREGSECSVIERIIKNARSLLWHQAQTVYYELGSTNYIRICREIHTVTSAQVCTVLAGFLRAHFSSFLSKPDAEIEGILAQVNAAMEEHASLFTFIDDMKKADKVIDDIATMSSLWINYESSLQQLLKPVYRTLILQPGMDEEFSTDVLGKSSQAKQAMQSLLILYVRLEHASVARGLMHAIDCDSIYVAPPDDSGSVATSTLVDDTFFLLQKAQKRAVATADVQAACATLNQVNSIIQGDLRNALVQNLLNSQKIYKDYLENPDNLMGGSWYIMLEEHFASSKQVLPEAVASMFSFVHCLNNVEECLNFLSKFKREISEGFNEEFIKHGKMDLLVENTLESMDSVISDYEQLLDASCKYALSILKFHIADPLNRFNEIDFNIDEEAYASYQSENTFLEDMIGILRAVFEHISAFYAPVAKSTCINSMVERICKFMETSILNKKFTIYGAVELDSTIRSLMQLCTSYEQQTRQYFVLLLIVSDVLNCGGSDELGQFEGQANPELLEKYFALRTDAIVDLAVCSRTSLKPKI